MEQNRYKAFFQKTGKILFAIAMADKKLDPKEYDILEELIHQEWELTSFGENETKYISQMKYAFDWLIENPKNEEDILTEYELFKTENLNFFTPEVKDFVYKTAHKIAASYAKKNKSELILLAKLHFILKE